MIVNEEAVKKILEEVKPAKLVAATKYVDVKEIEKLDMPHTAKYVINHYIVEGRFNSKIYGGIAVKNDVKFIELENFD